MILIIVKKCQIVQTHNLRVLYYLLYIIIKFLANPCSLDDSVKLLLVGNK